MEHKSSDEEIELSNTTPLVTRDSDGSPNPEALVSRVITVETYDGVEDQVTGEVSVEAGSVLIHRRDEHKDLEPRKVIMEVPVRTMSRPKRYRTLKKSDFQEQWNVDDYDTTQNSTVRLTITNLIYGNVEADPRLRVREIVLNQELVDIKQVFLDTSQQIENGATIDDFHYFLGSEETLPDGATPIPMTAEMKKALSVFDMQKKEDFGTGEGVVMRCLFNIFGVIMFIRLPWVFGVAGIGYGCFIIIISQVVALITTLSISAIVTNGEAKSGGSYSLISRVLGPEVGGPVGVVFTISNFVAVSLVLLGLAETVRDIVGFKLGGYETQVLAYIALMTVFIFYHIGLKRFTFIQKWILFPILIISILSIITGIFVWSLTGSNPDLSLSAKVLRENSTAEFGTKEERNDFFSVLAIFFPGSIGFMAGLNISASLAAPEKSIPKGTLIAIGVSFLTYMCIGLLIASSVPREVLREETLILAEVSLHKVLVYAGIFVCSFSQAITAFSHATGLFVNIARDDIYPFLRIFTRGDSTKRAYSVGLFIAAVCIIPGQLNLIAPFITTLFIIIYAAINLSCFLKSYTEEPGWRPKFRYYNKWIALLGSVGSVILMFILDYVTALVSVSLMFGFGVYLYLYPPQVNWGGALQSIKYKKAYDALLDIDSTPGHAKNYRLELLVFCTEVTGNHLAQFANYYLKKGRGLLIFGTVIIQELKCQDYSAIKKAFDAKKAFLDYYRNDKKFRGFPEAIIASSFREGARSLLQTCGISRIRPNVVVLGFSNSWAESVDDTEEMVDTIREAFLLNKGVIILRGFEEWDFRSNVSGRIDVWWLIDDGGLTLLVPHIITLNKQFKKAKLRVMEVSTNSYVSRQQIKMVNLLSKFRIKADTQEVRIEDDMLDPSDDILDFYNDLLKSHDDKELDTRTTRLLYLSDRIREHSKDATMVVICVPVPDVGTNGMVYMSWLDCLSHGLPPTILIRGNQESVLTWEL